MDNPFNPFSPLGETVRGMAADRTTYVDRIGACLRNVDSMFAVATGAIGVGKSTLLRCVLATRLREEGWFPIVIVASAGLTTEELLVQIATELGLGGTNVLERLGLQRSPVEQETGSITNSSAVAIVQAEINHRNETQKQWSPFQAAAAIQELSRIAERRIVVLVDQTEHLFLGAETENAILVLETLVRAATSSGSNTVGAVVAIRAEFLHHLLVLAGPFPIVTSGIIAIPGLDPDDAAEFVRVALEAFGATFSKSLLTTIIRRLSGFSGTIWPVALHACCRPLAELSKSRGRTVTIRDLRTLGDLSGVVGKVVASAIREADPPFADDAVFGLSVLSDLCQRHGQVKLEDFAQSLPAFPLEDVVRMTQLFKALRLIEEPRPKLIRLAHDSLGAAVFGLRHDAQSEEEVRSLDRAVAKWGASDEYLPATAATSFLFRLEGTIPTPHLLLVTQSLFRERAQVTQEWQCVVETALKRADSRQITRLVVEHAARHGRAPALNPEEVFVLAVTGDSDALATAMAGLVSAAKGPGAHWIEADYGDAIGLAAPVGFGEWLSEVESWQYPAGALRCIIRSLLQRPCIPIEYVVIENLWAHAPSIIKPELLALVARRFSDAGEALAKECARSDEGYLRAAAADVAAALNSPHSDEVIHHCLHDESAAVRRRSVFAVGESRMLAWENTLLDLLHADESPLVREACLEVLGHWRSSERSVAKMMKALDDPVDFVRESAIYSLAHVLTEGDAAATVADFTRDPSPKVREAAMRVMAAARLFPDYTTAIADIRSGPPSLRVAAAETLLYAVGDDVDAALDQVLRSTGADRDTVLASLRTAGARGATVCIPTIVSLLSSKDVGIVCEAIIALAAIGEREVIRHIEACAFHVSVDVRERAVYALADLGGIEAIAVLTNCLSDPRDEIRVRAIYALGRLGAAEAEPRVNMVSQASSQAREAVRYYMEQVRTILPCSTRGDRGSS